MTMEPGKIIKTFTSKKGNKIILRYPAVEDLDQLLGYVNNLITEDTSVLISGKPITRENEKQFLRTLIRQIKENEAASLVVEMDGKIVGMTGLTREKYRMHHVGMLGISLATHVREEGIGSFAFSTIIEEAKKMNIRLLALHCFENNVRALHMYEKFGFKRVGVIPQAVLFHGTYVGQIIMYLLLV